MIVILLRISVLLNYRLILLIHIKGRDIRIWGLMVISLLLLDGRNRCYIWCMDGEILRVWILVRVILCRLWILKIMLCICNRMDRKVWSDLHWLRIVVTLLLLTSKLILKKRYMLSRLLELDQLCILNLL